MKITQDMWVNKLQNEKWEIIYILSYLRYPSQWIQISILSFMILIEIVARLQNA